MDDSDTAADDSDTAADDSDTGADDSDNQEVRIGYLHSIQSDAHLWTGIIENTFEEHGIDVEITQFDTGIALAQALSGGSVDLGTMGAVISNFPARGQGQAFLANNIEAEGAQIWVSADSDITTVTELAGEKVATTAGTTGQVMLYNALKDEDLAMNDVGLVDSDMPTAVNAFISGSVPALATWVPYDTNVREQLPDATLLTTAADYFPEAAILGGWVASNDFYSEQRDILVDFTSAWMDINAHIASDPEAAIEKVQKEAYEEFTSDELFDMYNQQQWFTNEEWAEQFESDQVIDWIGQTERVFVEIGGLDEYVEPEEFFDSSIFLDAYEKSQK